MALCLQSRSPFPHLHLRRPSLRPQDSNQHAPLRGRLRSLPRQRHQYPHQTTRCQQPRPPLLHRPTQPLTEHKQQPNAILDTYWSRIPRASREYIALHHLYRATSAFLHRRHRARVRSVKANMGVVYQPPQRHRIHTHRGLPHRWYVWV